MSQRSATTHRTGPDQLDLFHQPEDKPAQPVRQAFSDVTAASSAASRDTGSPQGWERCAGGYGILVSGSSKRRWWRCPSCGWVGFQINTPKPPEVPSHHRPKEGPAFREETQVST